MVNVFAKCVYTKLKDLMYVLNLTKSGHIIDRTTDL